jgi:hypothetical protein
MMMLCLGPYEFYSHLLSPHHYQVQPQLHSHLLPLNLYHSETMRLVDVGPGLKQISINNNNLL